ncbi:hypothetical protein VVR46_01365 [Corynebacterium phoceense]
MSIEPKSWSVTDYLDSPETIAAHRDREAARAVGLTLRVDTMED